MPERAACCFLWKACGGGKRAKPLRASLALAHLPTTVRRLFARALPAGKAPREVGSWPSLRGLRGVGCSPVEIIFSEAYTYTGRLTAAALCFWQKCARWRNIHLRATELCASETQTDFLSKQLQKLQNTCKCRFRVVKYKYSLRWGRRSRRGLGIKYNEFGGYST